MVVFDSQAKVTWAEKEHFSKTVSCFVPLVSSFIYFASSLDAGFSIICFSATSERFWNVDESFIIRSRELRSNTVKMKKTPINHIAAAKKSLLNLEEE